MCVVAGRCCAHSRHLDKTSQPRRTLDHGIIIRNCVRDDNRSEANRVGLPLPDSLIQQAASWGRKVRGTTDFQPANQPVNHLPNHHPTDQQTCGCCCTTRDSAISAPASEFSPLMCLNGVKAGIVTHSPRRITVASISDGVSPAAMVHAPRSWEAESNSIQPHTIVNQANQDRQDTGTTVSEQLEKKNKQ